MSTPALSFKSEAVGHLLEDRWLDVPIYQRPYAWESEHLEAFWSDLQGAKASGKQYFLGAIVLTSHGERDHVIDGQQRLATASLLLAALRDELLARDEIDLAKHVEQQYLMRYNAKARQAEPKLRLGAADAGFFVERFIRRSSGEPSSSSQRRLTAAFEYFRGMVADPALDSAELMSWVDLLAEQVLVVLVEAESEADAFQIFETLNDRGAPLTLADLLKNYLLSLGPDEAELIGSAWDRAANNLGTDSETQDLVTFIRHFWSSLKGATRERDLYASLRSNISDVSAATEFAEHLATSSEYYAAILDSKHVLWADFNLAPRAVETLDYLQLGQYRPLMLAALDVLPRDEVERLSEALVCWSVRGLIVGGVGGGTTERAYAAAGVAIREGKTRTIDDVFNQLRPIIPSDDDFRSAFETSSVPRVRFGQYLLRSMNRHLDGIKPASLEDASAPIGRNLGLGYVLPRRAEAADWPGFAPDDLGSFVHRVGNMVLRGGSDKPASAAWSDRLSWILGEDLAVNASLSGVSKWTPSALRHRQQEMANWAVLAWPRRGSASV